MVLKSSQKKKIFTLLQENPKLKECFKGQGEFWTRKKICLQSLPGVTSDYQGCSSNEVLVRLLYLGINRPSHLHLQYTYLAIT